MRMILACLYAGAFLLLLLPLQLWTTLMKKTGRAEACYRITDRWVPWWMGTILKIGGVRVEVEGAENLPEGPAVFVCNHQSMIDIPVLLTALGRPRALMAKAVLGKVPLLRGWMRLFDCIFVQRDDPKAARHSYEEGVRLVKNGRDLIIFPEGTRSKDGELLDFKAGSFRIASVNGVPLVPLLIDGSRWTLEENGGWLCPGRVTLRVFPPIPTETLGREELKALPGQLHDCLADALAEGRAKAAAAEAGTTERPA